MTKAELGQLNDLRAEIKELEQKISKLEQMGIEMPVKVKASYSDFPYIQGHMTVMGYDEKAAERRDRLLGEKRMLLISRKAKAEEAEKRIIQYINGIPDSKVRRIMQYKYVDGYTWEKIGEIMHCDRTTAEKTVKKYLKENK